MIPQRNLSLLSNRIARDGGRRIPEAVLERDYCIAWFLAGLSGTSLSERLAFKGGTAMKHCYFGDYRFSEDLDFTLVNETGFEAIRREMDGVFAAIRQESAMEFRFAREDRHSHANSYTFYLSYEGPLPAAPALKATFLGKQSNQGMENLQPRCKRTKKGATARAVTPWFCWWAM